MILMGSFFAGPGRLMSHAFLEGKGTAHLSRAGDLQTPKKVMQNSMALVELISIVRMSSAITGPSSFKTPSQKAAS